MSGENVNHSGDKTYQMHGGRMKEKKDTKLKLKVEACPYRCFG